MTKLICVLHGHTDWNSVPGSDPAKKRLQGQSVDLELNDYGIKTIKELSQKLAEENHGISKIISSHLKRSRQTGQMISKVLGVPLVVDSRLRECDFGSLEGRFLGDIEEFYRAMRKEFPFWNGSFKEYDFRSFGGESLEEVLVRQTELIKELSEKYSDETILLVGHSTALNTLLHGLGETPDLKRGEWRVIQAEL